MLFHLTGTITDVSRIGPFRDEEIRMTDVLRREGVIVGAYRRAAGPGVWLITEADSLEDVKAKMARLPFVAEDLLRFEYEEVVAV